MKGYKALFAPPRPGELTSGEVIGFIGPGEPGPRRVKRYDPEKRRRNKRRRQAIRMSRRRK